MTNHPNRNWRAQARQAAESWLSEYTVLHDTPAPAGEGLRNRLREAYLAGFEAGREQNKPRRSDE